MKRLAIIGTILVVLSVPAMTYGVTLTSPPDSVSLVSYLTQQGYTNTASPAFTYRHFDADGNLIDGIYEGKDLDLETEAAALKGFVAWQSDPLKSGIEAGGAWAAPDTVLFWNIVYGTQSVTYNYTFFADGLYNGEYRDISHLNIQVSEDDLATEKDETFRLTDIVGDFKFWGDDEFEVWFDGNSSPTNLQVKDDDPDTKDPGYFLESNADFYSLKIEDLDDLNVANIWSFSFESTRVASWGNFYAKDGLGNTIYAQNNDPTDGTGALILRPDGAVITNDQPNPVPEPATLAIWSILGAGAAGVGALRRRKQRGWTEADRSAIYEVVSR